VQSSLDFQVRRNLVVVVARAAFTLESGALSSECWIDQSINCHGAGFQVAMVPIRSFNLVLV
jgi:hypothetical protein